MIRRWLVRLFTTPDPSWVAVPYVHVVHPCGAEDPDTDRPCTRPAGHGGRHAYAYLLDREEREARVARVWGSAS